MRQRQSTPASLSYGVASERRMTNNDKMVNLESAHQHCRFTALGESTAIQSFVIRTSLIDSSFVIRISSFQKIRVNPWLAKPIENPMDDLVRARRTACGYSPTREGSADSQAYASLPESMRVRNSASISRSFMSPAHFGRN